MAVSEGVGAASVSMHPSKAIELIRDGVKQSLEGDLSKNKVKLPKDFILEIGYKYHGNAYRKFILSRSYPKFTESILFKTDDYFEIMRITSFVIG